MSEPSDIVVSDKPFLTLGESKGKAKVDDEIPPSPFKLAKGNVSEIGALLKEKFKSADEFLSEAAKEEIADLRTPLGHQTFSTYTGESYSGHHSPYGTERSKEPTLGEILLAVRSLSSEVATLTRTMHSVTTELTALDLKVTASGHAQSSRHEELRTELQTVAETSGTAQARVQSIEATVALIWGVMKAKTAIRIPGGGSQRPTQEVKVVDSSTRHRKAEATLTPPVPVLPEPSVATAALAVPVKAKKSRFD